MIDEVDEVDEYLDDPELIALEEMQEKLLRKEQELSNLTITINGIEYDANNVGQLNMSAVGAVANWQYQIKMLEYLNNVQNPSQELLGFKNAMQYVYDELFKNTKIWWKGTDNVMHHVQVESIMEALHLSMERKGEILAETNQEIIRGIRTTAKVGGNRAVEVANTGVAIRFYRDILLFVRLHRVRLV